MRKLANRHVKLVNGFWAKNVIRPVWSHLGAYRYCISGLICLFNFVTLGSLQAQDSVLDLAHNSSNVSYLGRTTPFIAPIVSVNQSAQDCPTITNTNLTTVSICSGQLVSKLEVNTNAAAPPYQIEFVRFDEIQANPYLGKNGVPLAELPPSGGKATVTDVIFPANLSATDKTYYVYACLKPEPDISVCSPFALITVTVKAQLPKCLPVAIRKTKSSRFTKR